MALRSNCPSCGAPIAFDNKASLYAVCAFCKCAVLRTEMKVENLGKVAELADDGTPLQVGTSGTYKGKRFRVLGRIQLSFPAGFWNEWYIAFENGWMGWLGEAQGTYAINFMTDVREAVPSFEMLTPGMPVRLNGETFHVKDIEHAEAVSAEGELPFRFESGWKAPVADCSGTDGRFATLDYSDERVAVYIGEYLEFGDLDFKDVRKVEGW